MTKEANVSTDERRVLVLAHTGREAAVVAAEELLKLLVVAGLTPMVMPKEAAGLSHSAQDLLTIADLDNPLDSAELVVVLGGDGTILRGAELVRGGPVPLLGINLGHVGFLAESERDDLDYTVERIAARDYEVEERMTLDVTVHADGERIAQMWAVNEASVEKADRERLIEVVIEIDGRPVTEFGCDGVILATPTGSTAYAFSAGGPIVHPAIDALVLTPIAPHTLTQRPLVLPASARIEVRPQADPQAELLATIDGQFAVRLMPDDVVQIARAPRVVRLLHTSSRTHFDMLRDRLKWGG